MAVNQNRYLNIAYYTELQRRMIDIFRYVSCHERNFNTYSIILESLFVDTGAFFDSLCQTLIRTRVSNGQPFKQESIVANLAKKVSGKDNFNISNYRDLLEGDFTLSAKEVNLNPYEDMFFAYPTNYRPDKVTGYLFAPFKEWANNESLPWWKAFTDLKHDRVQNFRAATLGNVIYALAAVFILLTIYNESDFKEGHVALEIYDLFLPKYWQWKGRKMPGQFTWL